MRLRKQALGNRNLIGARVEAARKSKGIKKVERYEAKGASCPITG